MLHTKKEKNSIFRRIKSCFIKSRKLIIGSFIITVGIGLNAFVLYNYFKPTNLDKVKIDTFFLEETDEVVVDNDGEVIEVMENHKKDYIAILEIPAINLINGLVDINSKDNKVSKNIEIIKPSDMPNVTNGNLILAAHSGTGRVAYFRNVHKLKKSDEINIYYNGSKYVYKVFDIYDVEKTGEIKFKNYKEKTVLTMVTCKTKTNYQIVVVSELVNVEAKGD